jgi:tungstate transport system substrate-binding protein
VYDGYFALIKESSGLVFILCKIRRDAMFTTFGSEKESVKSRIKGILATLVIALTLMVIIAGCFSTSASPTPPQLRLRVATTTSLYDTGLWGYLEPMFEEQYNIELDIIYAGTGRALEYGRRGDVDIIVVHSKELEEKFVAEGYGLQRVPFAYNYFLIVGPEVDPADISGLSPQDAFRKLMATGSSNFISRGDDSGTHNKEKRIWEEAGYQYETVREASGWYFETGSGMGPTLRMASEKQAYTLTDMGTYFAYKSKLELEPIVDKGNMLLNVYSVIAVSTAKTPDVKNKMTENLINFIISPKIQENIGNYGIGEHGRQLFIPCAGAEPGY